MSRQSELVQQAQRIGDGFFNVDSLGRVTMPDQPAFFATGPGAYSGSISAGQKITFFNVSVFDRQSNYNTSTQRFTAPVAGVYQFNVQVLTITAVNASVGFYVNGSERTRRYMETERGLSLSAVLSLNQSDYVELYFLDGGPTQFYGTPYSSFSGYLIG